MQQTLDGKCELTGMQLHYAGMGMSGRRVGREGKGGGGRGHIRRLLRPVLPSQFALGSGRERSRSALPEISAMTPNED